MTEAKLQRVGSAAAPDSKPWVEKYRPKTLDDVAAHKDIIDTIKKLAKENRLPHLLFHGPPGTGKTSTILAVARQIFGPAMANMILELNASDDRGIGVVRQEIQDFASTRQIFNTGFKLVVLDECDAMTKDAQFALRRVIEKYSRNTRFCLICNYVSKVIPALQSRCTKFRYPPLDETHIRERLHHVVEQEGVTLGDGGMDALVKLGNGDMRRTLNILQSTFMASEEVNQLTVYSCTGSPLPDDIKQVAKWLLNDEASDVFKYITDYQLEKGIALVDIIRELCPFVFSVDMPEGVRIDLVDKMAAIENNLAYGTSEKLQLGALLGCFLEAREGIVAAAK
mmetsp:Transcript_37445/g.105731  ORF Transcript_37445/g.105731 Transcript_37445/m.105731 type:complete len:339 (-) Transcript_37445:199-1215(-)